MYGEGQHAAAAAAAARRVADAATDDAAWEPEETPLSYYVAYVCSHNFRPMLFGIRYKPIMPWVNKEDNANE